MIIKQKDPLQKSVMDLFVYSSMDLIGLDIDAIFDLYIEFVDKILNS